MVYNRKCLTFPKVDRIRDMSSFSEGLFLARSRTIVSKWSKSMINDSVDQSSKLVDL